MFRILFEQTSYVETKCQLDATKVLLQIIFLAQHVSGTTTPVIRSSTVLYSGCCLWYFVLWFSSCCSGVELRVIPNTTDSNYCIILLSS